MTQGYLPMIAAVHEPIIIGGVVVMIVIIITAVAIAEHRRKKRLVASLSALGLNVSLDGRTHGVNAFSRLGPLMRLRNGASGVRWHAEGQLGGLAVTLVEHRYTTGHGKNRRTHYHTVAATPCPTTWPTVSVTAEHLFHKIAEFLGSKDIKVEDPAFNSRWRVKGDSEDFTVLMLSPDVQQYCQRLPRGVWLEVGQGAMCVVTGRRLDGPKAADLVQRVAELRSLQPAELDAWNG
jgi:hypothetical protein